MDEPRLSENRMGEQGMKSKDYVNITGLLFFAYLLLIYLI
jgi:hypothetical protein